MRRQLCSHLASVAVSSEIADLEWIRTLSATLAEAHRLEWTSQVSWMLGQLPPDAVEHQWQRWMGEYWRGRLDSVPVELTANEASALAGWAIYLTESIGEGVNLATARPASLGEHARILPNLDENRIRQAPASLARLVAHLLRETQPPFGGCFHLTSIVPVLRDGGDAADINTIIEEATRLGCNTAEW